MRVFFCCTLWVTSSKVLPTFTFSLQQKWVQEAVRSSQERRHIFETINKTTPGLDLPCTATSGLTSAVNGETGRKSNEMKKKVTPIISILRTSSPLWSSSTLLLLAAASRQQTHTSELGWQEGVEDKHHRLWTRVEVKHLEDKRGEENRNERERGQERDMNVENKCNSLHTIKFFWVN